MKRGFIFAAVLALPLVGTAVLAQNNGQNAEPSTVTLYGQTFTIDTAKIDKLNGDDVPYKWRDTAYLVRNVLPGMLDGATVLPVEDVLSAISDAAAKQRYDVYECSIYNLAQRMEKDGQLDALFLERQDNGSYVMGDIPERLVKGTSQDRIDWIYGGIGYWIARDTWRDQVDDYNAYRTDKSLSPFAFENPAQLYKEWLALFNLETVVRASPQVQDAGLGTYGTVPAWTPDCMQGIGPEDYSPQGLDHRDRDPLMELSPQ